MPRRLDKPYTPAQHRRWQKRGRRLAQQALTFDGDVCSERVDDALWGLARGQPFWVGEYAGRHINAMCRRACRT